MPAKRRSKQLKHLAKRAAAEIEETKSAQATLLVEDNKDLVLERDALPLLIPGTEGLPEGLDEAVLLEGLSSSTDRANLCDTLRRSRAPTEWLFDNPGEYDMSDDCNALVNALSSFGSASAPGSLGFSEEESLHLLVLHSLAQFAIVNNDEYDDLDERLEPAFIAGGAATVLAVCQRLESPVASRGALCRLLESCLCFQVDDDPLDKYCVYAAHPWLVQEASRSVVSRSFSAIRHVLSDDRAAPNTKLTAYEALSNLLSVPLWAERGWSIVGDAVREVSASGELDRADNFCGNPSEADMILLEASIGVWKSGGEGRSRRDPGTVLFFQAEFERSSYGLRRRACDGCAYLPAQRASGIANDRAAETSLKVMKRAIERRLGPELVLKFAEKTLDAVARGNFWYFHYRDARKPAREAAISAHVTLGGRVHADIALDLLKVSLFHRASHGGEDKPEDILKEAKDLLLGARLLVEVGDWEQACRVAHLVLGALSPPHGSLYAEAAVLLADSPSSVTSAQPCVVDGPTRDPRVGRPLYCFSWHEVGEYHTHDERGSNPLGLPCEYFAHIERLHVAAMYVRGDILLYDLSRHELVHHIEFPNGGYLWDSFESSLGSVFVLRGSPYPCLIVVDRLARGGRTSAEVAMVQTMPTSFCDDDDARRRLRDRCGIHSRWQECRDGTWWLCDATVSDRDASIIRITKSTGGSLGPFGPDARDVKYVHLYGFEVAHSLEFVGESPLLATSSSYLQNRSVKLINLETAECIITLRGFDNRESLMAGDFVGSDGILFTAYNAEFSPLPEYDDVKAAAAAIKGGFIHCFSTGSSKRSEDGKTERMLHHVAALRTPKNAGQPTILKTIPERKLLATAHAWGELRLWSYDLCGTTTSVVHVAVHPIGLRYPRTINVCRSVPGFALDVCAYYQQECLRIFLEGGSDSGNASPPPPPPEAQTLNCDGCGLYKPRVGYQRCSRCAMGWYCSKECQRLDWSSHKSTCVKKKKKKKRERKKEKAVEEQKED